ncbi:MAG: hypothetical protein QHH30_01565 [candidate division NC10 bacterium]|nr:hypothetical protein [candidate division NC10 bacterium]
MKDNAHLKLRTSLFPCLFLGLLIGFVWLLVLGASLVPMSFSAPSAHASPMEIRHSVGAGEDLHLLAAYYYGDARQWKRIYQANRKQIKNPNYITPKQVLRIEVADDWRPLMSFPAWMQRVTGTPSLRESPPAKETPSPAMEKSPEEKPESEEAPGEK